jgi:ADP-ribose pyrophosphatase
VPDSPELLGKGRFLQLTRTNGWEYVERTRPIRSIFIAAITNEGELLLTYEYRVPVKAVVVGFPAGLVGDTEGLENEAHETATVRELIEETGYEPRDVRFLTKGPTSAGITDEVIAIMLATGLKKVGAGGGIEGEQITVHKIKLADVDGWLEARGKEGMLIDPKVYTALYFIDRIRE